MTNSKELEGVISQMLKPLKGISLGVVIEGLSGHKIVPFDKSNQKDITLLAKLEQVAVNTGKAVNKKGIVRPRPNEVGNDIEPFVKAALNKVKYKSGTPTTADGKHKSMGYPDIEFTDEYGRTNYLECKTFNIENIETSQRSFFLSPSENFKVTKDAHHFVICFEIYVSGRRRKQYVYKCKSWKILTLENLEVDIKYEFNSDNARMYAANLILAQGEI